MVQGGTSSIAEATPAAKASARSCREASASTSWRSAAALVMDKLTGSYKSDRIHVRDLLERLAH